MELKGKEGELRFTLEIKRAATGETEIVELVGKIGAGEVKQILGEQDGGNTQHGGQITLGASTMTVNIPDESGISIAGVYLLRLTFVDVSGNIRGLTPDTETLRFW